jgi:hypothetical protein
VNAAERDDEDASASGDIDQSEFGKSRTRGSPNSDVWHGSAVDLADKHAVAIYPVNGWWRFHPKEPEICERKARYALVVSIETDEEEVDVYSPVFNQIALER